MTKQRSLKTPLVGHFPVARVFSRRALRPSAVPAILLRRWLKARPKHVSFLSDAAYGAPRCSVISFRRRVTALPRTPRTTKDISILGDGDAVDPPSQLC